MSEIYLRLFMNGNILFFAKKGERLLTKDLSLKVVIAVFAL